jgi:hypothetical protein
MKKLLSLITVAAALLCASNLQAQTTLFDNVLTNFVGATNWAVEPYFTYAPKSPSAKVGGGALVGYDFTQNVGLALGIDWLGQFSLVSGNVTLQAPFHLSTIFPSSLVSSLSLSNVIISPFALAGVGTASSGGGSFNGAVSTIEDAGAYVKFGHFLGGQANVGVSYGQWTGSGQYDVKRYHAFLGMTWGF